MEEGTIDIMLLLRKAIKYWFLFVAGAVIAFAMAVAYLKYKEPSYQGSTMILVEDDKGSSQITEEAIFKDLGLVQGSSNLINEMSILKSTPL